MLHSPRFALFVAGTLLGTVPGRSQTVDPGPLLNLEPLTVSAPRITANETEGPQATAVYDPAFIESSGAFSAEEFINSLPGSADDTPTLVLIDGRPTYLDPNSLPLGLIAAIEVSDAGAMPQYGEFHNGRIINIRLKPNHTTRELGTKFAGAWAGGGFSRTLRAAGAINRDKLRALYSIEISDNQPLSATARDFSVKQDRRADGGRDLRLPWGSPAVVVATEGFLTGMTDANGNPTHTALVPAGQRNDALTPGDFLPPDTSLGDTPAGQRRFNTAPYRRLVSPSQRVTLSLGLTYTVSDRLRISLEGSHRATRSERLGAPPVTPVSRHSVVPAAHNPFNQDVAIGMVHEGFGPTRQQRETRRDEIGLNLDGTLPGDWRWESTAGYRREVKQRSNEELDPAELATALADPDPVRRFNPFADPGTSDPNAHLYPSLTSVRTDFSRSRRLEAEVGVKGPVFPLPGGPARLDLEAGWVDSHRERSSLRAPRGTTERNRFTQTGRESSAALQLPFIGADQDISLVRRLEVQLAGEYESSDDSAREFEREAGVVWSPFRSLMFRARFQRQTEAPAARHLAGSESLIDETLLDPARGGEAVTAVRIFTRDQITARDEEQSRYSLGMVVEPPGIRGLQLNVTYQARTETGIFEDSFSPQEIVNNATAFADRIQRAAPTGADLAAGRPGRIVAVDLTPGSTGQAERSEVEFKVSYRPPSTDWGQWRFTGELERTLSAGYEILPGIPYVSDGGGSYRRPRWQGNARVTWNHSVWNAAAHLRHTGVLPATAGAFNGIGSSTTLDVNVGRRWNLPGADGHRRQVKLVVGIGNLLDRDPPQADTVDGYRGGSPLGRTYSGALSMEF